MRRALETSLKRTASPLGLAAEAVAEAAAEERAEDGAEAEERAEDLSVLGRREGARRRAAVGDSQPGDPER